MPIAARSLMAHVEKLCQLAPRLTGTPSELAAAEYVAGRLAKLGAEVTWQWFPISKWQCRAVAVKIRRGRGWMDLPALPIGHTPSTKGVVEGELAVVEYLTPDNPVLRRSRGKVVLVLGMWGEDPADLEALAKARPAAALFLDDRFPSAELVQDGLPMGWVDKLRVPSVTIPYLEGWELARAPARVRVSIDCVVEPGEAMNVIGRLPGSQPGAAGVLLGAHHDSVAIGQSADDDATGLACLLEIASELAGLQRRRDLWLVSFGCEEHLSVGAEAFVRDETRGAARLATMINFDSVGSLLGHTVAWVTGPPRMEQWVRQEIGKLGEQVSVGPDVSPYSDHFFFTAAGVPAVWFYRTNCHAGRWYHHQITDSLEVVGPEAVASVARAGLALARGLVQAERLPYARKLAPAQIEHVRRLEQAMANWPPTVGGTQRG